MHACVKQWKVAGMHARVPCLRGDMQGERGWVHAVKTHAEKPGALVEESANACPSEAVETHEMCA